VNTTNPLDKPGTQFDFAGMNPNPSFANPKDGPVYRISFEVNEELWKLFVDANTKGMVVAARMFVSEDGEQAEEKPVKPAKPEKGPYGQLAQSLYHTGFFMNPKVLEALGTDAQYQAFVRFQPCIITGGFDWDGGKGEERCDYCHVRRSGDAGTSLKPKYSGVPMVHAMHSLQHEHGESMAYREYMRRKNKIGPEDTVEVQEAKDWFEKKSANMLYVWARGQLLKHFEIDSLTKVHPELIMKWATHKGIEKYLPKAYKEYKDEADNY